MFLLLVSAANSGLASEFGAYYTKVNSAEEFEKYSRTGPYADIVVRFSHNAGKLVFWRASSYLPLWKTPAGSWYLDELTPRSGDGTDRMPDKYNKYSKIRLIESSDARVIVHWRYAPNTEQVGLTDYVDEYFTVYPDGLVVRTFRKGAEKIDDWAGRGNLAVHMLELGSTGVRQVNAQDFQLPGLHVESGDCLFEGQDETSRAYVLRCNKNGRPNALAVKIEGASKNPVLVVKNWGAAEVKSIEVDNNPFETFALGYEHKIDGTDIVVWLQGKFDEAVKVVVTPGQLTDRAPSNRPPKVDAGSDQSFLLTENAAGPFALVLAGSVDDDGLPSGALSVKWRQVSGPATAVFVDAANPRTEVTLSKTGTYEFRLTADDGVTSASDEVLVLIKQNPGLIRPPVAWWPFNEGKGETTTEMISGFTQDIVGDKAIWAAGVSGTALVFNGWSSVVSLPADKAPFLYRKFDRDVQQDELALEAWIAIKAYPWNWTPIVEQTILGQNGYFLGIDYFGHLGFKMASGGSWFELVTRQSIPRNTWVHVAATYERAGGMMRVYIDGQLADELETSGRELFMAATNRRAAPLDVHIGRGAAMKPAMPIRPFFTDVSQWSFDGLIDEVKIYDVALSSEEIAESFSRNVPADIQRDNPALQPRVLPGGLGGTGRFGAYYTKLRFYDTWDNRWRVGDHSDVVVQFDDKPVRFVFWRGTSYIPHWVSENNIWYTNEFTESRTEYGCAEPMSDKESRHSHVRIIESNDARVVIHWRYALVDVKYTGANLDEDTGWFDWTDEYHYIYPDASSVRVQKAWSIKLKREWHEGIVLNGPEQRPEDNIEIQSMTLVNMHGDTHTYSWENGPPWGRYNEGGMPYPNDRNIAVMNLKSEYDPYVVGPLSDELILAAYNDPREFTKYSTFSWFNHWPMSYIISDGHHAHTIDRTTSTSMFWLDTRDEFFDRGDNYAVKTYLCGMTKEPAKGLAEVARAWLQAPSAKAISGCDVSGFDLSQKAYIVSAKAPTITFTLGASDNSPVINPCFVIKDWDSDARATATVNGKPMTAGPDFRQGIETDTDGTKDLVVWIKARATSPVEVSIRPEPIR